MEDYLFEEPYISNPNVEDRIILYPISMRFKRDNDSDEVKMRKKFSQLLERDIAELQAKEDAENVLVVQPMVSTTAPVFTSKGVIDPSCFDPRMSGLNVSIKPITIRLDQGEAAIDEHLLPLYAKMGMSHSEALNAVESLKEYVLGRDRTSVSQSSPSSGRDEVTQPPVNVPANSGVRRYRCFTKLVDCEYGKCEVLFTPRRAKQSNNEGDSSGQDGERTNKAASVNRVHWELAILKRPRRRMFEQPKTNEPSKSSGQVGTTMGLGKRNSDGQPIRTFENLAVSMRSHISDSAAATIFHDSPLEQNKRTDSDDKSNKEFNWGDKQETTPPRICVVSRLYRKYVGGEVEPLNCFSNVPGLSNDTPSPKCIYRFPGNGRSCDMDAIQSDKYCSYHARIAKSDSFTNGWAQYCMQPHRPKAAHLKQNLASELSDLSEPRRKRRRPEGYGNDSESSSSEEQNFQSQHVSAFVFVVKRMMILFLKLRPPKNNGLLFFSGHFEALRVISNSLGDS
ncbi:hypothetical protein T12_4297 [Trichinella patagoniensis]|uniref:Uncharacterized protein n=1 Tax=Trichinella patagoniensis TaxID=990121 RepID=A0A0V1A425_9BILA|nr:hypothetical protein T12_4297 [Trichinella patagoniensis]